MVNKSIGSSQLSPSHTSTEILLDRNQEVFVGDLTSMLCDLIGNENHQIGNASVHLLYGYRDVHGTLKTGSYVLQSVFTQMHFNG